MNINLGNKNKVENVNLTEHVEINVEPKTKKDGFWKQVFVNIMSNFLWKVLGILFSFGLLVALSYLLTSH